ncbi:asparagine synthase (glutamine-hydrolyzing) [Pontibacillus yanchengensis]|uniref:Asparagine synthase (Glutamine-hydrolyzing) n=2 Tax=Pontibacillus yanchengensis TaxID=462910 RepID=A0ACC7VMI3_9BACI|nr:asparagine synthase (glutamine-hydrolyzing) [Pontibacillus yanchengensis]MYL33814.1 asparagine synthase (glutamine-hydrolyzing) [Pontibacillus yanchengensis]MYL55729.1 asparagine synthase (glutamine-hydrolyzing) [Pontibacillus yanchengensis]
MCGFIGVIRHMPSPLDEEGKQRFKQRNDIITHRGPDDEGYYHDEHVSFGFRRLSIIDIESGHQPLSYEDERYWMVFNGEIYNYVELRESLQKKGYTFETESDTEVIAVMFSDQREQAFSYLRGMFSILIWDKQEQTLFGARDPFGIKPLFYSEQNGETYFASEKKSITLLQENELVNTEALQHYLSFQYVPEPLTLTDGIHKVEPGYYFVKKPSESIDFHRYFHATFTQVSGEQQKWIKQIQDVLYDSVNVHMRSDVPVGSFLSGGIDSSIIVAMAREFNPNIKTFSVGFERDGYSEVDVAKETADKLGVENISYTITPEEYIQKLPKIMWHMDDPLADPACVPLYFVAREARKHVTVVLSGEGADELFGGYNIYREPESLKMFDSMPGTVKSLLGRVAKILPEGVKGKSFLERGTTPLKDRYIGNAKMFEEADKNSILKDYHQHSSYQSLTADLYSQVESNHPVNQMQYIDMQTWLRGDILLKADKMTMANSLELRVPFLDKEVFNVARELPVDMKIAEGTTKSILRKASRGIVPDHVLDRKKLGFPVPIRHWLKDELYDWAKQLIQNSETDHLIEKKVIMQLLENHVQGKADYSRKIWTVLMFMLWHQIYVERKYSMKDLMEEDKSTSKLSIT